MRGPKSVADDFVDKGMRRHEHRGVAQEIEEKTALIGVVGLGYVGLPLAVEKAKAGYRVIGFDIQQKRVDMVNRGINYIGDVVDEELANLVETGAVTRNCGLLGYCPGGCRLHLCSHSSGSVSAAEYLLREGVDAADRQATPPRDAGGPGEHHLSRYHRGSGSTHPRGERVESGTGFLPRLLPERVDPGNKVYKTKNTPKVVGGITGDCTRVAAALYRNVLEGEVFEVSGPAVAEMEKILENTFRNSTSPLPMRCQSCATRWASTTGKWWRRPKPNPTGLWPSIRAQVSGGHCIPIDPYYLTWKAQRIQVPHPSDRAGG